MLTGGIEFVPENRIVFDDDVGLVECLKRFDELAANPTVADDNDVIVEVTDAASVVDFPCSLAAKQPRDDSPRC